MKRIRPKALDLFCGAGGAAMGLYYAGFDVTGVDNANQPHYPFRWHQADALTFALDGYDFIWASPVCKRYSAASNLRGNQEGYPDQIGSLRERLVDCGTPWVIENVVGAPLISPAMLCGTMFGLRVFRHRLFEASFPLAVPAHARHDGDTGRAGGKGVHPARKGGRNGYVTVVGHMVNTAVAAAAMDICWMNRCELSQAVPPAYAEYIGKQVPLYGR